MAENNERIPLFLINGFLEAGKTQFINFTIQQEYFQTEGKTLLIVCEEGEEEYDEELLAKHNTVMVVADDEDSMTEAYLMGLQKVHNPERVLMEWNGMWDITKLQIPSSWEFYQQISIMNGATLEPYLNNNDLKSLVGRMVRSTELLIVNRCDGIEDKLAGYHRVLKGMNAQCDIVFENSDGEIDNVSEEDLPYDVNADVIVIPDDAYGIWYIDTFDKPERYRGKTVEFTGMVLKRPEFPANDFVPGRMAMTCCAADMSFLGFMCKAKGTGRKVQNQDWVRVRAKVEYEYRPEYEGDGPMLYAEDVQPAEPIEGYVGF